MEIQESDKAITEEADSFVAMHLNETGMVEEFIDLLKNEIKDFDEQRKREFIRCVIQKIEKEKTWHDNICSLENCKVKMYFDKCLEILKTM